MTGCEKTPEADYPSEDTLTPGIFLDTEAERAVLPAGVEVRKVYHKGVELTKESEGFRSRLYNDAANYCTIGYGHLIKLASCDGSESNEFRAGISVPQGTEILRLDMEKAERGIMMLVVDADLTDGQYGALCDFVFNVGVGNFRKSTLRKRVNASDFDRVPFEFRRWVFAGGRKLPGLAKRREKEIALFFEEIGIPRAIAPPDVDLSPIDIRSGEAGS
jgi:GH24 family phage-related lysozyme (muramidase)